MSWLAGFGTLGLDQLAKATVLLVGAWLLTILLRRASASARHLVWAVALVSVLALPLLAALLPSWNVVPWPSGLAAVVPSSPAAETGSASPGAIAPAEPVLPSSSTILDPSAASQQAGVASSPGAPFTDRRSAPETAISPEPGSATVAPRGPAEAPTPWTDFLPGLWLAGTLILLARLGFSTLAAMQTVRQATAVEDDALLAELEQLKGQLGLQAPVRLVESPRLTMPMAWSLIHHTVLLPAGAAAWDAPRRRVVLLHELAHLKRYDCQTLLVARLAASLHWFNPLAWIAVRRLVAEREHACDDLVLTAGTPGADYAQHLLDIARGMRPSLRPGWAMVAMARPSELEGRLLAILDPDLDRGPRRLGLLGAVLLAGLVLPLASLGPRAVADEEAPRESAPAAEAAKAGAREAALPRAARALTKALSDPDPKIRSQAAHSLGMMENGSAVSALARAVESDDSADVRAQAAWALGLIEHADGAPVLMAALGDAAAEVREQSAWALGMIEDPSSTQALMAALGDADAKVREQSAWALGMIEDPSTVGPLAEALSDPSAEVREQSAWALGMIEDPSSAAALGDLLADEPEARVRRQVAWALGMIESAASVQPLLAALARDADAEVREQSAWALGMIEDPAALDGLLDALENGDAELREKALWAVGRITG